MIYKIIHLIFVCYTAMLMIRIIGSWFPHFHRFHFMRFVVHYTDPYLKIFRKIIPPIGGVLDLSPLIAFLILKVLESLILSIFR
jgi:YggT family protein